jgi:REP element-mobilizing transposase RayT
MSHSLVKQLHHIVFATKGRRTLISPEMRDELHAYIGGILRSQNCRLIKAGGRPDHIHLLVELSASVSLAACVQKVKCNSSRWIKIRFPQRSKFAWQDGYGAFSESSSRLPLLKSYIENQELHHRKVSFNAELRQLALDHGLDPTDWAQFEE